MPLTYRLIELRIDGRSWTYQIPPPEIRSNDPTMDITPGSIIGNVRFSFILDGHSLILCCSQLWSSQSGKGSPLRQLSLPSRVKPLHYHHRPTARPSPHQQNPQPLSTHHSIPNEQRNVNPLPIPLPRPLVRTANANHRRTYSSMIFRRGNGSMRPDRMGRGGARGVSLKVSGSHFGIHGMTRE